MGVIDKIGPQYVTLSFLQIIFSVIIIYFFSQEIKKIHFRLNGIYFYVFFLIFSIISIVFSSFREESILEWVKHFTNFHTLVNMVIFFFLLGKKKDVFFYIILTLSLIESIYICSVFFDLYMDSESFSRYRQLQGFSSNQNIAAFSLLIKIPILLYLYLNNSKKAIRVLSLVSVLSCFFCIQVIASRGALLGATLILLVVLVYFIFSLKKQTKAIRLKLIGAFFLIITTIGVQNTLLSYKNKQLMSSNRMLSYNDSSVEYRVGYIYDTLNHLMKYPLIGSGIGTWKIYSIDYVRDEQKAYEAPYHAHNDFLQIFAETGIFGGLSYLMIFVFSIFQMIIGLLKVKRNYFNSIEFFLLLCLIIYCIDSVINFPRIRPYSQMNIIYILGYFLSLKVQDES